MLTREDGSLVGPDGWSAAFERHVAASGLPHIRYHDLRHTHATLLLAAGVPPEVVSERLGHTTVAFTLDTYARRAGDAGRGRRTLRGHRVGRVPRENVTVR